MPADLDALPRLRRFRLRRMEMTRLGQRQRAERARRSERGFAFEGCRAASGGPHTGGRYSGSPVENNIDHLVTLRQARYATMPEQCRT